MAAAPPTLPNTDADARELYDSLRAAGLLHPASRLLTNEQATTKNVADAFARAAAAAGPNDTFLFFFSGHGDQVDVPASAAELDGRAETIELYDAAMTDAELAPLFAGVRGRMSIVVIDACYAGGFRSLVDRPNVMGLFSSEEDLTSLVATRFKAGGFLSYFLRAGLAGEADDDGDRIVTAGELSTYVRRRFRREGDIPATTREDDRNYPEPPDRARRRPCRRRRRPAGRRPDQGGGGAALSRRQSGSTNRTRRRVIGQGAGSGL